MKCRAHDADLSAHLDGELSATEERALRDHLAGCPDCRARLEVLTRLGSTLAAYRDEVRVESSSAFVDRILAGVGQRTARRPTRRAPNPAIRFPRYVPLAAAAALLLIATVSLFYLVGATAPAAVDTTVARTDLELYRMKAGELPAGDAGAHLDLAAWCAERGLAAEAARETLRAWGADPESPLARRALAELILSPDWSAPEVSLAVAELQLGGRLADPRPQRRPLTREEMLTRFGFTKDEVWGVMLTKAAQEELRNQREWGEILADRERHRVALARAGKNTPKNPAAELLMSLRADDVRTHGALTIVALADGLGDPGVSPLDVSEALAEGVLTLKETSDGVFAINDHPNRPVYFAPGDILVGARQDRIVRRPTLVSAKTGPEPVPVLCCEKNRSWGPTDQFAVSPGIAPMGIRHLLMGVLDNEPVWNRIAMQLAVLEAGYGDARNKGSLKSVYRRGLGAAALDGYRTALLPALSGRRTVGFLVYRGERLLGGDVFATHELLTRSAPRYLAGYVLDTFWPEGTTTPVTAPPAAKEVRKVLDSVASAVWLSRRGAATGREYEFLGRNNGLSGLALVPAAGVRPVHISLFPHRKPPFVTRAAPRKSGATPPPSGTTAGSGGAAPPPPDDKGKTSDRKDLEKTRERRKKLRSGPKKLPPPEKEKQGPTIGGNRVKSGGGGRDPRFPE